MLVTIYTLLGIHAHKLSGRLVINRAGVLDVGTLMDSPCFKWGFLDRRYR